MASLGSHTLPRPIWAVEALRQSSHPEDRDEGGGRGEARPGKMEAGLQLEGPPPSPRHRRPPSAQMGLVFPRGLAGLLPWALDPAQTSSSGCSPGRWGASLPLPPHLNADPLSPSLLRATDPSPSPTSPIFPVPRPRATLPPPPALQIPQCGLPPPGRSAALRGSHSDGRWLEEQLFLPKSFCLSS